MTESEKKKVSLSTRYDADLFDLLDTYINSIPREIRPTKDSIIQQALREFLAKATECHGSEEPVLQIEVTNKLSEIDLENTGERKANYLLVQIQVPKADVPWVEKLLRVLHSTKRGLSRAAKNNMEEFDWAVSAWDELKQKGSALVSSAGPGAGRAGGAETNVQGIDGARKHGSGDQPPETEFGKRLSEVEKDQERHKKGKKDTSGKTG